MVKKISGNGNTQVLSKTLDNTTYRITGPVKQFDMQQMTLEMRQHPAAAATLAPIQALSILNFYSKIVLALRWIASASCLPLSTDLPSSSLRGFLGYTIGKVSARTRC